MFNFLKNLPMLKAAIIEGNLADRELFKKTLNKHFSREIEIVEEATTEMQAYKVITKLKPDIIFANLNFGKGKLIPMLQKIPNHKTNLVVLTKYDQFTIRSLKYSAIEYLITQFIDLEIEQRLDRILASENLKVDNVKANAFIKNMKTLNCLAFKAEEGTQTIEIDKIIRCESKSGHTHFLLNDGETYMTRTKILKYDDILSDRQFCLVHDSHLINLHYVDRYAHGEGGILYLKDKSQITVSKRRREDLLERLLQYD